MRPFLVWVLCLLNVLAKGFHIQPISTRQHRVQDLSFYRGTSFPTALYLRDTRTQGDLQANSHSLHNDIDYLCEEENAHEPTLSFNSGGSEVGASNKFARVASAIVTSVGLMCVLMSVLGVESINAQELDVTTSATTAQDLKAMFDPSQFSPVCPSSDTVYSVLKSAASVVVGPDNVMEYGPLIASVLLRIRLELCVLESFVYEAIVPFVRQKGLSWVLPLHETVETFVAGTIFAVASNFILLGSTKILTVLYVYFDALTGFPARNLGKVIKKASPPRSPGQGLGSALQGYGELSGVLRRVLEGADTFVGRYLVVATTAYIAFKFAHFKLFNDIF